MNSKIRYLTTMLVATVATGAAIGLAPIASAATFPDAGRGPAGPPQPTGQNGPANPPNPGYWDGGQAAGGTGIGVGANTGTGPSYWRGGDPAGGTGIDSGPDTASGPGIWSGGEAAGAF